MHEEFLRTYLVIYKYMKNLLHNDSSKSLARQKYYPVNFGSS